MRSVAHERDGRANACKQARRGSFARGGRVRRVARRRTRPRLTARSGEHRLPGGRAAGSGTRISRRSVPDYGNEVKPPSVAPVLCQGRSGVDTRNVPGKKGRNVRRAKHGRDNGESSCGAR